jgi:hypothetical protein
MRAYSDPSPLLSLPGLTGQSSNPCAIGVFETSPHLESGGYWIARSSRAMTVRFVCGERYASLDSGFALTRAAE